MKDTKNKPNGIKKAKTKQRAILKSEIKYYDFNSTLLSILKSEGESFLINQTLTKKQSEELQKIQLNFLHRYGTILRFNGFYRDCKTGNISLIKSDNELIDNEPKLNYKDIVQVLNRIGTALNEHKDLDKLLGLIIDEIIDFIGCDACSLYLRETKPDDKLIFKVARTVSLEKRDGKTEKFKNITVPLKKDHISGFVAITGDVLNVSDCYKIGSREEYKFHKTYDEKVGYRTKSMLTVPMKLKDGTIIGVLQVINKLDKKGKIISFSKEYENIILSIASQAAISIENTNLFKQIEDLCYSLVLALSVAIDARSKHTAGHSRRVADIVGIIVDAINEKKEGPFAEIFFTDNQKKELNYASLLHDAGKISIPESILDKKTKISDDKMKEISERFKNIKHYLKGKKKTKEMKNIQKFFDFIININESNFVSIEDIEELTKIAEMIYVDIDGKEKQYLNDDELFYLSVQRGNFVPQERLAMESHVVHGVNILRQVNFTPELKNIPIFAGDHHEKLDGKGYPNGKKAKDIPLEAKIMAVADIFEALTAIDRPYKKAIPLVKSITILKEEAQKGALDKDIVDLFINERLYEKYMDSVKN